jgi:hypothetical protein
MATLYSSGASTPDATEATAGKVRIATAAEATAGTNDTTAMTPLKVADAIAAGSAGVTGALVYRGPYDANTQSPDLTTASKGDFYLVSVAGALDGVALSVGDHVVFSEDASDPVTSAMFDKIDSTDAVSSVNGQTGVVTLTASDVSALASGDNISTLTNDSGYITSAPVSSVNTQTGVVTLTAANVGALASGDNVSELTNDSGYITSAPVTSVNTQTGAVTLTAANVGALATGDNVSELTNDSGYLTSTLSADIIVDTDGAYDLGAESARLGLTFSDLDGAVTFKASNASGAQIAKGQPVYIAGVSGDVPTVALADADAAAMPCAGLAAETANSGAAIRIVSFGNLTGVDTSSFSLGDTLYIDTTAGQLTATPPAGEASKLQNIGKVIRVHASSGVIKVGGAGRSAATPNLDQDKIFLGDSNNRAVSTALSAVALSSFNNDLGLATVATSGAYSDLSGTPTLGTAAALDAGTSASNVIQLDGSARLPAVDGSQLTNLPSASAASETTAGVVEIATNAEATAATATDKAIVPSNLGSVNVSTLNNDAGYLTSAPVASVNTQTGAVVLSADDLAADHTAVNYTAANANIDGHLSGIDTALASAGGGISNVVEDTTPQLGGNLDPNGHAISGDLLPSAANTHALGSADAEWSDLYLGDGGVINFGNDQDIKLSHTADQGLILSKSPGGAFYPRFTLQNQDSGTLSYAELKFESQSTTPATGDFISRILASGKNSAAGNFDYTKIETRIADATDSTEAGRLLLRVGTGGTIAGNSGTDALDIHGTTSGEIIVKIPEHDGVSSGLMLNNTLVTTTAAELNLLDGGSSVGASVTIADTDGLILNDNGVTKLIPALDLKTYAGGGGGGTSYTYSAITGGVTAAQAWYHYSVDTSGGAATLNLPALSTLTDGDEIRVKLRVAGNDLTIDANSTETIDGGATLVLDVATSSVTLVAGSTEWEVI